MNPDLPPIGGLGFSVFSKPSYFCMWKFVSIYKSQFVLSAETKFHTQKCNTPISPNYKFYNSTVNLLVELNRCPRMSSTTEKVSSLESRCAAGYRFRDTGHVPGPDPGRQSTAFPRRPASSAPWTACPAPTTGRVHRNSDVVVERSVQQSVQQDSLPDPVVGR